MGFDNFDSIRKGELSLFVDKITINELIGLDSQTCSKLPLQNSYSVL